MGQLSGRRTWVGGNIGKPLIDDLHKMGANDVVVQELSSFQLEVWDRSPHVAAVPLSTRRDGGGISGG